MVEPTNHVDQVVGIVGGHRELLPRHIHFSGKHHFAFIIDHEAAITSESRLAFKTSHQYKFVVWNINGLEIVWDVAR